MIRLALRSALSDRAGRGQGHGRRRLGHRRAEHQGRRSQLLERARSPHRGRARRRACCSCSTAAEEAVWKSFRNLGERVQIVLPEELNTYDVLVNDWLVFRKATLDDRRSPALRRAARRRRGGDDAMSSKDPRDIIIRPVVSEKSYAALRRERLHVRRRRTTPTRSRSARRSRRSSTCGSPTSTRSTARASASATAAPVATARARAPEAGDRLPRRGRRPHRDLRELTMPIRKRKPTSPGRRFQTVSDFAEITTRQAREVAHQAEAEAPVAATRTAA